MANLPDITDPLEKMGNVTDEVIKPAITGAEVTRLNMRIPNALMEMAQGQEAMIKGIGQGLAGIAKGLGGGGGGATQDMAREGALEGRASVTRDTQGDIQIQPTTTTLFGRDGQHYSDAAYAGTMTAGHNQLRHDLTTIAAENEGNVEGLRKGVNGYLEGHLGGLGSGQAGRALLLDARDYGQQLIDHAVTKKAAGDIINSRNTLVTSIDADQKELFTLAQGGASKTTNFFTTLARQEENIGKLEGNPAFGISPDMADLLRRGRKLNLEDATIQGAMASGFEKGGMTGASAVAEAINERKDLSPADKIQLTTSAQATLAKLQAGNKDAMEENKQNFEEHKKAAQSGKLKPEDLPYLMQPIIDEAIRTGDGATANRATGMLQNHPVMRAQEGLLPQQIDQLHGGGRVNLFSSGRAGAAGLSFDPEHPDLSVISTSHGLTTNVNRFAAPAFQGFVRELESRGYNIHDLGGFNFRNKRDGNTLSEHAFGNAIDINPEENTFGGTKTNLPPDVSQIAAKWGLSWGGDWRGKKDYMHFEWTGRGGPSTSMAGWKPTANDTRADKNFNPGNIAFGPWAQAHGATGSAGTDVDHEVAVFASPEDGFAAMAALALDKYTGGKTTADQLIAGPGGWTPGNHGAATDIARRMGLGPNDDLRLSDPARMKAFQKSLAIEEGAPRHVAALGGGGGSGGSPRIVVRGGGGVGFTAEQLRENPYLMSEIVDATSGEQGNRTRKANNLEAGMTRGLQNQMPPNVQNVAEYHQLTTDDEGNVRPEFQDQHDRLFAKLAGTEAGVGAALSPGGGQALIDEALRQASGGDIYHQDVAAAAMDARNATAKGLKDDPFGTAARLGLTNGVPAPINYGDPNSIAQGIATRGRIAQMITGRTGQPQSALGGPDDDGAKTVITSGTPQQKAALLGSVVNLPSPIREATLATIGAKGEDGAVMAQAGQVALTNPEAAQEILQGQALLKAEPRFGPKPEDYLPEYAKQLPPMDFSAPDVRGRFLNAAKAYYAAQMAKAGKADHSWDETLWKTSLDAVTGGVLDHNGTKVIAPRYGETQAQLDETMANLPDAALAGATLKGAQFPAAALAKPWFTSNAFHLVSRDTDAGTYFIMGGTKATPSVIGTGRFGPDGREIPFILNLRDKQ